MKIIISEFQYQTILESNLEKNKKLLNRMLDDNMSISEIKDAIGLTLEQIYFLIRDREMTIGCEDAIKYIISILGNSDLIRNKVETEDFKMEIFIESITESIYFNYDTSQYRVVGLSTVFWGGVCDFPIDVTEFVDKRDGSHSNEELYRTISKKEYPTSFNSIQEIIDFMNNDYFNILISTVQSLIPELIDER